MVKNSGLLLLFAGCFFLVGGRAAAQFSSNYAVQVSAAVEAAFPTVSLAWPSDVPEYGYSVYRKLKDQVNWGSPVLLPISATGYVDIGVSPGIAYEYAVYKDFTEASAEGYIFAGIEVPLTDDRGKIILIVDETCAPDLEFELTRLEGDLAGDGWTVLRHDVPRMTIDPANTNANVSTARSNEVAAIKAIIDGDRNPDPANVKAVFLFGHVPVPYAGDLNPDGQADHRGAWPADIFYGTTNGVWTDSSVSNTTAADPRNWNVPADGKFDQGILTSVAGLQVGRVDFANLPAFPESEVDLLRRYLDKNHEFRHGLVPVQRAGLIDDNLGVIGREAFAVNGWRNFAPLFGRQNILAGDWLSFASAPYLWAYGCGTGTFASAANVVNTLNLVTNGTPSVFTMLYGDYFGDWDSQNNLMRAQLANPGFALACAWAGRPYWYIHHMGLGETIGFSARLCQNGAYGSSRGLWQTHVALMGDPTLRLHSVVPPSTLLAVTNQSGWVTLIWNASPDEIAGYHVYTGPGVGGPFTRLTSNPVIGTTHKLQAGSNSLYMVRAVKLETTPSGSYWNASQGIFHENLTAPLLVNPPLHKGSEIELMFTGDVARTYSVERAPNLGAAWISIGTATVGSNGTASFTDNSPLPQRAFYRVAYP